MKKSEAVNITLAAFCKEVIRLGSVWTLYKDGSIMAIVDDEGQKVIPLWSKESRTSAYLKKTGRHPGFTLVQINLSLFLSVWVKDLKAKGVTEAGINWSGAYLECQATIEEVAEGLKKES